MKWFIFLLCLLFLSGCGNSIQKEGFIRLDPLTGNVISEINKANETITDFIEPISTKSVNTVDSIDDPIDENDDEDNKEENLIIDGNEVIVKTPDGDVKIVVDRGSSSWCEPGTKQEFIAPAQGGTGNVEGEIKGIVTDNSTLNGLCEIFYRMINPDESKLEIYNYFNFNNEILYAKDMNGNITKKES